jgi:hypothetical protein
MPGPSGEACRTCYFAELWTDETEEDPYFCRRYPPSADPGPSNGKAPIPITVSPRSWCGEWKERK